MTRSLSPASALSPPVSNQSNRGLLMLENEGCKTLNYWFHYTVPHTNTPESLHNHMLAQGQNKFWNPICYCFITHVLFSRPTSQFATLCCYLLLYTVPFTLCTCSIWSLTFNTTVTEPLIWTTYIGQEQVQQQEESFLTPSHLTTYMCHTALLTSRRCILNIYSTNIRTEYLKHAA
jgi:hypothetical protein